MGPFIAILVVIVKIKVYECQLLLAIKPASNGFTVRDKKLFSANKLL